MRLWRHEDMGTWGHGDMRVWGDEDMGLYGHEDMGTWGHGNTRTLDYWYVDSTISRHEHKHLPLHLNEKFCTSEIYAARLTKEPGPMNFNGVVNSLRHDPDVRVLLRELPVADASFDCCYVAVGRKIRRRCCVCLWTHPEGPGNTYWKIQYK